MPRWQRSGDDASSRNSIATRNLRAKAELDVRQPGDHASRRLESWKPACRGYTPPPSSQPAEADLKRRPDNVGQSGRWRHNETGKTSPRYGHEEAAHSKGWPAPGGDPS